MVGKGKISALYQDGKTATVKPYLGDVVTPELVVPYFLFGCLAVGMPVVYVAFEDNTGVVLARMDGEWNHKITGSLEVTEGVKASSVMEGSIRLGTHKHNCPDGETSGPK